MTDDPKNEPGKRMRNILSDPEVDLPTSRLPRLKKPQGKASLIKETPKTASVSAIASQDDSETSSFLKKLKFGPAFWTVTGILSLITNAVLIGILVSLLQMLGSLQVTAGDAGAGLVGGLYTNFEKMENAHITATIPVVLPDVPVDFVLNYSTNTEVVLTSDVPIQANVSISSGIININGPASIVLQKDTRLPVHLDLQIPVQTTVDIDRQLLVDIPLASTDLSEPFQGLQDTIEPIYCLLEPNALDMSGNLVCR